jgi:hypothetical protein
MGFLPRNSFLSTLALGFAFAMSLAEAAPEEDVASCTIEPAPASDFAWMEALANAMDPRAASQSTENPPVLEEDEPLDEVPSGSYDVREPAFSKLRRASRGAAGKCRVRGGRNLCGTSRAKGLCFRGVKEALLSTGLVKRYLPGMYAKQAHTQGILVKEGFENLLDRGLKVENAPLGSILVYAGGPKGYGHIEIKLGKYEYCSDFCKSVPGGHALNRKLIGIYAKPAK